MNAPMPSGRRPYTNLIDIERHGADLSDLAEDALEVPEAYAKEKLEKPMSSAMLRLSL